MAGRRRTKKREQILDAGSELFQHKGIRRVTVAEVCERASVSKVTFYKYFTDKTELARSVLDMLCDRVLARLDELEAMDVPFVDKAREFVAERARLAAELSPEFVRDLYGAGPELADFVRERAVHDRKYFIAFLERAQSAGDVRRSVSPELILAVVEKLTALGADDALVERCGGFEAVTRGVNEIFFFGVLAD